MMVDREVDFQSSLIAGGGVLPTNQSTVQRAKRFFFFAVDEVPGCTTWLPLKIVCGVR